MSTTYKVRPGDGSFDRVSRHLYGNEKESIRISRANPGVSEPLLPGIDLKIPLPLNRLSSRPLASGTTSPSSVEIKIDRARFRFWTEVRITRSMDKMDVIELNAPFDPGDENHRRFLKPFSFKDIIVSVGGNNLFTGTMVKVSPKTSSSSKDVYLAGYSTPAVLGDCTVPVGSYPNQSADEQPLNSIIQPLIDSFGLVSIFKDDDGAIFERVSCEPDKKILSFIIDLAKQRGLLVSSTPEGELLFHKEDLSGAPVANLKVGESPVVEVSANFSEQQFYSSITGIEPVIVGLAGSKYTYINQRVSAIRPFTFLVNDVHAGDVKAAVEAKAGRMYGDSVSYSVTVSTWRDVSGNLWKPNTRIKLKAPQVMIYSDYTFLIKNVTFFKNDSTETALLDLVLPGSFAGLIPESLPWDS